MRRAIIFGILLLASVGLVGCKSPKFTYAAPSSDLDLSGPSIVVMPIADHRTNRAMDRILAKGYFQDVQKAIADELRSMNKFRSVATLTNASETPVADLKLSPGLWRLEWEIPHYNALLTEAFVVGFFTGIVGGTIDMMTKTTVCGHSQLDIRLEQTAQPRVLLEGDYSASVTNRLKKGVCDTPKTKAAMMAQALQQTMVKVKVDIQNQIQQPVEGLNTPISPTQTE